MSIKKIIIILVAMSASRMSTKHTVRHISIFR